jgi:NADPH-dependent 2,4-dienoyl-CoA reductase/sulfur reductase-like enzyme/rhodanese-related sulfurtransferase
MSTPRTIAIVGAVAGGASAAARARRTNEHARIILIERGPHASFANCGLPYYVGGEIAERGRLLLARPERFRDWLGVELRTGHEAVAIDPAAHRLVVRDLATGRDESLSWDRLILAPGAAPIRPPVPGADAANVYTLRDLRDADRLHAAVTSGARRAVVVGAGYIGLELTEMLARRGLEITVVERLPQVLQSLDPELAAAVSDELRRRGICVRLGIALDGFRVDESGRVGAVALSDGTEVETDLVVLALGVRPETGLAIEAGLALGPSGGIRVDEYMRTSADGIYAVGDAVEYVHAVSGRPSLMPLAGPATRAGRIAGEHAATDTAPAMAPVLGTSIVRVFGVVAGSTGLTRRQAVAAGLPFRELLVPGHDHATYYPGAAPLLIKVLYHPQERRLLGAQVVGREGVDKRLDVLATAIRLGGTAEDLASLDLAYAPPYGSARDPIHIAGFMAENESRGLERFVAPQELAELPVGTQLLDVRTPAERAADPCPDALAIPLDELRARVGELDRERPVVTICKGGQRAYFASRILQQRGFGNVRTATGGMMAWHGAQSSSSSVLTPSAAIGRPAAPSV